MRLRRVGPAAAPLGVRANGIGHFDEVWVARSGTAYGASGSSCRHPHFVADGSDDQDEISWALEDTNPNGTVHMCPGTYRFSDAIDLNSDDVLTIDGAGMNRTILDGGAEYLGDVRLSSTSDIIYFYGTGELTMSNLTVQNAGGGYGALYGSSTLVVDRREEPGEGDRGEAEACGDVERRHDGDFTNHCSTGRIICW